MPPPAAGIKRRATTAGRTRANGARSSRNGSAPAPADLPLWGELSLLDADSLARLRSASKRLSRAEDAWLAAAGRSVGGIIGAMTGVRKTASAEDPALPEGAAVNVWAALAARPAAKRKTALEDELAIARVCALYWLLVPGNLLHMHAFLDRWPGTERAMLSRSLRRLGSVREMYQYLAAFEAEGELPPFGATAGVLLSAARQSEAAAAPDRDDRGDLRSLIAGGDLRLAPDLAGRVADRGTDSVLLDLQGLLSTADIAMANLETVIANGGRMTPKHSKRPLYLHAPPALANVLVEGGITCVTAANDHALDFGAAALAEQTALLKRLGLAQVGADSEEAAAARPVYLDARGTVVAVIAFEAVAPSALSRARPPGVFRLPLDEEAVDALRPLVREARQNAEVVLVSPHWGAKRQDAPSGAIRKLARALLDLGADAVLGHGAQVLQGVEVYEGRAIVYDMGCLVADRLRAPEMGQSALFELRFDETGVRRLVIRPVTLSPGKTRLARGEAARVIFDRIVGLSVPLNEDIRWRYRDGRLILALSPQRGGPRKQANKPPTLFGRDRVRRFTQALSDTTSAIVCERLPSKLSAAKGVDMGNGFVVLGQRRARRAATGCGFLIEVLFRCPDPARRSWWAALLAEPEDPEGAKFHYRHPVSEGMWLSRSWKSETAITDSFVVRPPSGARAGLYRLRWTLKDAESGRIWPAERGPSPVGWVELGRLEITDDAPAGVAGLDWGTRLSWAPLAPGDRSR